ncbi:MAG: IPT/TIG domain-containing protein, partial [Bacteroidales bacterium]|nr:IPT/TIG domain-containing protein [Bacteroidales bacterium]
MNNLKCSIQNMLITLILVGFGSEAFAQPVITSFSPSSGPIGTVVSIIGTGLASPTHFSIGGTDAIIISNDGIALVGMVMPGAITGKISIVNDGVITNSANNFSVAQALIPIDQQGSKLTPSGYSGASWHGESVSISADGSTAIVGGSNDNNYTGAAWIYTRNGGAWTQQAILEANDNIGNSHQGFSVAISADGNTAIVGGYGDNSSTGAAWIYTHSGSTWTQQGSKLVGTGNAGNSAQGSSVALSADGNTAILGGSSDNVGKGATWIFSRSGSTWTQQGSKLVGTDGIGQSYQGKSVALSADGNTTIVGGYKDNGDIGAVWIYARSGSTWTQQGSKLVGTGYDGTPSQGISVSLSADGNTAMVGGFLDDDYIGAAWIFTRSGGAWTQQGTKLIGSDYVGTYSRQGTGVALSADGNTALVGGLGDNSSIGASWVFTRSGSTWTQQGGKLVGTGYIGTPQQGSSVSLSADGYTAIVGGPYDNSNIGATWIFTSPPPPMLGSGTELDPYQVAFSSQLNEVRNNLNAYYIQTADIDLNVSPFNLGEGWNPIGDLDNPFTGNFNGQNYYISNLFINTSENFAGLFGMVDGATISVVNLVDVNISGSWYAGALAGFTKNNSEITKCISSGMVSGVNGIGGLIGESNTGLIGESYSSVNVSGELPVGGLAGYQNGTIQDSYAKGTVDGDEGVAGLVGHNGGTIVRCYSTAAVTASTVLVGGLAWANTTSSVTSSYWDTETSGQSNSSGGTGLTTALMKKQAMYIGAGWDIGTTWGYNASQNGGYPFLSYQPYSHVNLFDGGTGSAGDPWQISTAAQLDDVRFLLDSSFILTADLDLGGDAVDGDFYHEGAGWEPLGSNYEEFTGNFEGNNHTISNLFINRVEDNYVGLFGYVYGAEISNISLAGIDITGKTWTGGL